MQKNSGMIQFDGRGLFNMRHPAIKLISNFLLIFIPFALLVFIWPIVASFKPFSNHEIQNPNTTMFLIVSTFYCGLIAFPAYIYVVLNMDRRQLRRSLIKLIWIRASFFVAMLACVVGIYFSYYMMMPLAVLGLLTFLFLGRLIYKYEKRVDNGSTAGTKNIRQEFPRE